MLFRAIFIFTFHFVYTRSNLQCSNCAQKFNILSTEVINTGRPECDLMDREYSNCLHLLHLRYSKNEASVLFEGSSAESLVLSNAAQMMTNTTMIWLNKFQLERTFQIFCFNNNACRANVINDIYVEVRGFEHSELWANLVTRLYEARANPDNLVCADNQDKSVPCPNGFCQSIISDSTSFIRSCVPKGAMANPYGVILESKSTSETNIKSSVIYTCNKPMCNNSTMAKEVRHLLETRGLLMYSLTTTTATTTSTTPSITAKRSTGNTPKPMISIQGGLIFLMAFIVLQ